jgi:endonuclease YncB( thermonuclease family)/beta-lactam-binding protein with PASTA domain
MTRKIVWVMMLLLSITVLVGCEQNNTPTDIVLPNLNGMTKSEALNALSGLGIQVSFDDVIDNSESEGAFAYYGNDLKAGDVVLPNAQVVVYFYIHVDGIELPDLTGLTLEEMDEILINLDLFYSFEEVETTEVEEGLFVQYKNNFQVGQYVDEWETIVIEYATEPYNRQLIISKYVEGTDNNKAIELTNLSDEIVDLSEYKLDIYLNGSDTVTSTLALTGTLAVGETFVIVHPSADQGLLDKADLTSNILTFDGNDAVAISFKNDRLVDIIGTPGFGIFYLANETFVRKASITQNKTVYNILDWDIYAVNQYFMLGIHPTAYPTAFTFDLSLLENSYDVPTGMVKVTFISNNDGDTAQFNSLDPEIPHFTDSNRVRFIGIDTPETFGTPDAPQPYALAAKDFVDNMLSNGTDIYIMHDPVSGNQDTYARALGLIWVDGVLLNVEVVRAGFSTATYFDSQQRLVFNGVSLNRLFERAEQEARAARRGIWT